MKKLYFVLILLFTSFMSFGQTDCSTAVPITEGTQTQPATPNDNYYWYEFTMPSSGGKLKIGSPDGTRVELNSSCTGFTNTLYVQSFGDLLYYDAEPNEVILIEVEAGNTESFEWTVEVLDFVTGELCSTAVEAVEGTNNMPLEGGGQYWYTFTMPDVENDIVYFILPDFNFSDIKVFEGDCSNLTNERNILASSNLGNSNFIANQQYFIKIEISGQSSFDWTIEIPETGERCSVAKTAIVGTNTLPATDLEPYWFKYTTPADVAGKKLQANVKEGVEMILTKNGCGSSSIVQERDSSVFALDLEAETDYYFRFNNIEGGDFDWELLLTEPDAGDQCSDPIVAEEGQQSADFTPQWFSFTATEAATYEISSEAETSDKGTVLKIYDSCEGTIRAENNPSGYSSKAKISLELQQDETILLLWESDQFNTQDGFTWTVYNTSRQQITFNPIPEKTFGDDDFELSAFSTSGLNISYNSSNTDVASIEGSIVTINGAGKTVITASQEGNVDNSAAIPVERSLVVNKAEQEVSITAIVEKFTTDAPFEVEASSTSELALTYEVSGPATIEGSTISLDGTTGTVEVTASQAGNDNYNSASETISFEVTEDPCLDFAASATAANVNCAGEADGTITVETTAGTAPFTYSLAGAEGIESNEFTELTAGEYTIEVTDANGCTATTSATISSPDALEITAEVENSNSILGNGSIALTVTGGTADYTYSWSNGAETASISELEVGEYTVTVTDANDCSIEESFTIGGVTANEEALSNAITIFPNPAKDIVQLQHSEKAKSLKLYDATGKLLNEISTEGSRTEFNVSQLPSGLYFIKQDGASPIYRFVKE